MMADMSAQTWLKPPSKADFCRSRSATKPEESMEALLSSLDRAEARPPAALPLRSVVKLFVTSATRSYLLPWVVGRESASTGTGFVLHNRLIMTNAHVVDGATVVEVKKADEPKKYRGTVVCIGHDFDLALVEVSDERFWTQPAPLEPIVWGAETGFADLYSEVRAVGFPAGGVTVCVTKGVVSRLDAHLYVHPRLKGVFAGCEVCPGNLPILQIDAAINPGNSGGPAFDAENRVIGVASSGMPGAQNVGYIIPTQIAKVFLDEFAASGKWTGICETGMQIVKLESDTMREFLRMGQTTGVRIRSVAPLGAAAQACNEGDILVSIDGTSVSNEGTCALKIGAQNIDLPLDVLVTSKPKGVKTKLTLLRDGSEREEVVEFGPIGPLAPRFDRYDSSPQYVLLGGVVFTKMTVPLINEYLKRGPEDRSIFMPHPVIDEATDHFRKEPLDEVVVRLRALKHTVNLGYDLSVVAVLKRFNGEPVQSLKQLAAAADAAIDSGAEFLRFGFGLGEDKAERPFDALVLRAQDVRAADRELSRNTASRPPSSSTTALQQPCGLLSRSRPCLVLR